MKHNKLIFLLLILFVNTGFIVAQEGTVKGIITEKVGGTSVAGARISDASGTELAVTGADGAFSVVMQEGRQMLFIDKSDYEQYLLSVRVEAGRVTDAGTITLQPMTGFMMDLGSVSLDEGVSEDAFETQSIQGVLSSSADIFLSTAAYTFGPLMFRVRGYESNYTNVSLNGFVMNDIESGSPYFSNWGGLNDVMRNAMVTSGPEPIGFLFEPVGGATRINTRASEYRSGIRGAYSLSNRTYRNRAMLTYSTGLLENGWAFTGSYSHRWSQHGYEQGSFYNANSFFLAIEKKFNERHSLNFTALDAIYERGVAGGSTEEVYGLERDNFYNPNWGYQNGEVRSARVRSNNKPLFTLNHIWTPGENLDIQTTAGYWFGKGGYSALNWYAVRDPRPDYYQNLPSYREYSEAWVTEKTEEWRNDPSVRYLDWDHYYFANRKNLYTVEDASGITGNDITGNRSKYIVEDRRNDLSQFQLNTRASYDATEKLNITGGLLADIYRGHNFNTVKDLLGGDYWLDIDQFAERDFRDEVSKQNDLNNPNRVAGEGDIIGNNYYAFQRGMTLWGTARYTGNRYTAYLGANGRYTSMWREGLFRKGLFPESSFGESEKINFLTWGVKAGGEYRLTGRHLFTMNALLATNPPLFRNSFLSPRTRNAVTTGLKKETIGSADLSYILRSPMVKSRLTLYYTRFMDQTEVTSFYHDDWNTLVNYAITNIDKENYGIEFGTEVTIITGLNVNAVASVGQFLWVNNPDITVTRDNDAAVLSTNEVWIRYFRQSSSPQTALALGLEYNSSKFWWASITGSYYRDIYLDFNPVTRTKDETGYYPYWEPQLKADPAFLLDLFFGKSWKIDKIYINLSANISNVLNNKNIITGGFEQYRFDPENPAMFDPKVYYYNGLNYFINLSIRM